MEKVWEKSLELPYKENHYQPGSVKIDNNGDIYILGIVISEGNEKKSDITNQTMVRILSNKGTETHVLELNTKQVKIAQWVMDFDIAENLVVAGFCYINGNEKSTAVFSIGIDTKNLEVSDINIYNFTSEFYEAIDPVKNYKMRITLNDLVKNDNGGMVLLAEEYTLATVDYNSMHYHHTIIAIGIDDNYAISWANAIPKKQFTILPEFTGYNYFVSGDKLFLLYNDNNENLQAKKFSELKDYAERKSVIMLVTIEKDGKWKKEFLPSDINTTLLMPNMSGQADNKTYIFFEKDGKKNVVGKMQVE